MLKNTFIFSCFLFFFCCCAPKKEKADLILHHAVIYSVDPSFSLFQAIAVKDGKIIGLGSNEAVLAAYQASETLDAGGKFIFPGFIDAHCHFLAYGKGLRQVSLVGTRSFKEVLERVQAFSKKDPESGATGWIIGRGWDQNDWDKKQYPTNEGLSQLFPGRPVILFRVDGHAALINNEALKRAGINSGTRVTGGEILRRGNTLSGILIDNAVDLVTRKIPETEQKDLTEALLGAQNHCLKLGLTTVDDAGLMKNEVDLIDSLQRSGKLKIRLYAMLSDSLPNYAWYLEKGPYRTERLNVRSFKFYADGALGSRGACLLKDYSDKPGWKGFLLSSPTHFEKYALILDQKGFQMNTHCIGDSALRMILNVYEKSMTKNTDRRWRIEHAQVIEPRDLKRFNKNILPSVQPTHATSDMPWAIDRLGKDRLKHAYVYQELLEAAGTLALGTDFPVEDVSPFKTFFAAVTRQDSSGNPIKGFQPENALTRRQAIRGMTIWAAYANFEEKEKGSLEKGKKADFVILDTDLMKANIRSTLKTKVLATYINGEKVYPR